MQNPAPRQEQPQASVQAGGWTAGKHLHRKAPEGPGEQADCDPITRPHGKEVQQHP